MYATYRTVSGDVGDENLMHCSHVVEREFLLPLSRNEVQLLMDSRFPKRTVHQSMWAVILSGDWHAL